MKGFIFAAGLGTRLKPWTDHHPKALVEVNGKPMLQHVIEHMIEAGITSIIVNVHHFSKQIIEFIAANKHFGIDLSISDESGCLLDTGGAIVKAAPMISTGEPVLLHNADIYTNVDLGKMIDCHNMSKCDATLLISKRNSSRQLLFRNHRLNGWIDHNSGRTIPDVIDNMTELQPYSFNGIHIINSRIINRLVSNAPGLCFPIIPQYIAMCQDFDIKGYVQNHPYEWYDVGKPDSLEKARNAAF